MNQTPSFILTQFVFTPENAAESIVAEGNTVWITTDKRYATTFVLNCLTATVGSILDKETVMANKVDGDMGDARLATSSTGSGPYTLTSWRPNESVTLSLNSFWSGETPVMERVIVHHVQESATLRLLHQRGDIDVARNLNPEDVIGVSEAECVVIANELRGRRT